MEGEFVAAGGLAGASDGFGSEVNAKGGVAVGGEEGDVIAGAAAGHERKGVDGGEGISDGVAREFGDGGDEMEVVGREGREVGVCGGG